MQQREHGGVGADADGEREDGGEAEDRIAPQPAQPLPQIGEERLQPDEHVAIARVLLLQCDTAEPPPRLAPRVPGRRARGHQVVGALVEMKGDLAVDLVGDLVGAEDVADAREPGHDLPPRRSR